MSIAVAPGEVLPEDLDIFILDDNGLAAVPFSIVYGVYRKTGAGLVLVSGTDSLVPQEDTSVTGRFVPTFQMPTTAEFGEYRIIWKIQLFSTSQEQVTVQDFSVIDSSQKPSIYSATELSLMKKLRVVLRDNNPDRNYHFRPPAWEHMRDGATHHFGYIWEDEELKCFLELGVYAYNLGSPFTMFTLANITSNPSVQYPVIISAAALAINAVALNWVADEFDYSIGGKSLTIEKSSKYASLKDQFDEEFSRVLEDKRRIRHVGGVVQRSRAVLVSGGSIPSLSSRALRYALGYVTPWI